MIRREGLRTKDRDLTSVTTALKKSSAIEIFISPVIKLRMCKLIAIAREAGDRFFIHASVRKKRKLAKFSFSSTTDYNAL